MSATLTCTHTAPVLVSDDPVFEEFVEPPPPFIGPPAISSESWMIPDFGRSDPPFPYFPDEETSRSRSIGDVTSGYLVNSRPLPYPHPNLSVLPRQFQRHLQHTGDPMVELIEDGLAHLDEHFPGSVLYVGNFSRPGGGNIPHSVSHNSGRDADLAFFVVDEDGNSTPSPDLLRMDENGAFIGPEREETRFPELTLYFDTERNWRLVEGLIESEAADIQYIFVSRPLRQMLLAEGRRQNADARTLRIAAAVLVQPGGALPHDDHFHLRIHCTALDLASGCQERGRPGPTYHNDRSLYRAILRESRELLDDDHPHWRRAALGRLALLQDHRLHDRILPLVDDPDPTVRALAVRALRDHTRATTTLIARLEVEEDPRVFAELVNELSRRGDSAVAPLTHALDREIAVDLGGGGTISSTALVADALARLEKPDPVPHLIDALARAEAPTRVQITHALRILTNHSLSDDDRLRDEEYLPQKVAAWKKWWDDHGELNRDQWLARGFKEAGFDVDNLHHDAVWELCRAITDAPHLNFNAQRVLMRLSGRDPASLNWHPHDASFYWRRWFETRQESLNIPPVPAELSTADGYTPPE